MNLRKQNYNSTNFNAMTLKIKFQNSLDLEKKTSLAI